MASRDRLGLQKVLKGERFAPKVGAWNSIIDAANAAKERGALGEGGDESPDPSPNIVKVQNVSGATAAQFSILSFGDPLFTPDVDENQFRKEIVITGDIPEDDDPFVVLLRPLGDDDVGPALAAGVCQALVTMEDDAHEFARVRDGVLTSAPEGPVRILWHESTGSAGGTVLAVILWPCGSSETSLWRVTEVHPLQAKRVDDEGEVTGDAESNFLDGSALMGGSALEADAYCIVLLTADGQRVLCPLGGGGGDPMLVEVTAVNIDGTVTVYALDSTGSTTGDPITLLDMTAFEA